MLYRTQRLTERSQRLDIQEEEMTHNISDCHNINGWPGANMVTADSGESSRVAVNRKGSFVEGQAVACTTSRDSTC